MIRGTGQALAFSSTSAGLSTSSVTSGSFSGPGVAGDMAQQMTSPQMNPLGAPSKYAELFGSTAPGHANSWPKADGGLTRPSSSEPSILARFAKSSNEVSTASGESDAVVDASFHDGTSRPPTQTQPLISTPTRRIPKSRKRQLVVAASSLLSLVAVSSLTAVTTFGLFSASAGPQANTLSAGNVTFAPGSPQSCTYSNMLPGGTLQSCQVTVTYNGTSPAWLGLDIFVATKSGPQGGAENLYNPGAGDSPMTLSVTTTSPTVTFTNPTAVVSCPSTGFDGNNYTGYTSCFELDNELVSLTAVTSGSATFTIIGSLPSNSSSAYQNGTAVVVIRPHVVQSGNNGNTGLCVAGNVCAGIGGWS